MNSLIVAFSLLVTGTAIGGSNVHQARDGKTIIIDISRTSLNRLYVKGMRITKIRAVKNQLVCFPEYFKPQGEKLGTFR